MLQDIILVAKGLEIKLPSLWNALYIYHELKQVKHKQKLVSFTCPWFLQKKKREHVWLRVWGYLCVCTQTHTGISFFLLILISQVSMCINTCPPGWQTSSQYVLQDLKKETALFENRQWQPYGGLERERKELQARLRQTDRQTDGRTCSRELLPTRVWDYAANPVGIQLFTFADLLSTEIGCLPRRMR